MRGDIRRRLLIVVAALMLARGAWCWWHCLHDLTLAPGVSVAACIDTRGRP